VYICVNYTQAISYYNTVNYAGLLLIVVPLNQQQHDQEQQKPAVVRVRSDRSLKIHASLGKTFS
jgi:hypothetical protein